MSYENHVDPHWAKCKAEIANVSTQFRLARKLANYGETPIQRKVVVERAQERSQVDLNDRLRRMKIKS